MLAETFRLESIGMLSWQLTTLLIVLIVAAVAGAIVWRALKKPLGLRIKFLDPKKTIIVEAHAEKHCPACRRVLADHEPRVRCTLNPEHVIHEWCKAFMKGKCPECKGALE